MTNRWIPAAALTATLVLAACGGPTLTAPELDPNRQGVPEDVNPIPVATPSGTVSLSPGAEIVGACTPAAKADCEGAILVSAVLTDANFHNANLQDADLAGADLRGADLRGADLTGADFRSADLTGADMRDSIFENATFRYANLTEVDMEGAEGREGQLTTARLCETILPDGTLNVRDCLGPVTTTEVPSPAVSP